MTWAKCAQVSPKAFAAGSKDQEAGEISLQGTAIETPADGTPSMPELKVLYYNQMIRFHKESNNYIEIVRCLLAMYADKADEGADALALLKQVVWCAAAAVASCGWSTAMLHGAAANAAANALLVPIRAHATPVCTTAQTGRPTTCVQRAAASSAVMPSPGAHASPR